MSFVRVIGAEVESLAGRLDGCAGRMEGLSRALRDADAGGLGARALEEACEEFASDWGYGIGKLGECTSDAGGFLREAVRLFADTDAALTDAIGRARA